MMVNSKKTKALSIGFSRKNSLALFYNDEPIEYVENSKILGVYFDSKLNFAKHVEYLRKCISWKIGLLHRLRNYLPKIVKIRIYDALINSQLYYCHLIWGNSTCKLNLRSLHVLQKSCLRAIYNTPYLSHTATLFLESKITQIPDMFLCKLLSTLHKQDTKFFTLFDLKINVSNFQLRCINLYTIPNSRLKKIDESLSVIIPKVLNYFHANIIVIFFIGHSHLKRIVDDHLASIRCCF